MNDTFIAVDMSHRVDNTKRPYIRRYIDAMSHESFCASSAALTQTGCEPKEPAVPRSASSAVDENLATSASIADLSQDNCETTDIDLSPIIETDEDAFSGLDDFDVSWAGDPPVPLPPLAAVSEDDEYLTRRKREIAAYKAMIAAEDRELRLASIEDSFSPEESERLERENAAWIEELFADLDAEDEAPTANYIPPPLLLPADEAPIVLDATDNEALEALDGEVERRDEAATCHDELAAARAEIYESPLDRRLRLGKEFVGPYLGLKWKWLWLNRPAGLLRKARQFAKTAAAADRRRRKEAERKRAKRADPAVIAAKLLSALLRTTAKAPGNRFLEKIVGRESSFVMFRQAMTEARAAHGPKCSDRKIAAVYTENTGEAMNRRQAQNRRDVIVKLEAPGGAWHRLK